MGGISVKLILESDELHDYLKQSLDIDFGHFTSLKALIPMA